LKVAVQQPPAAAGIEAATWSWKAVRQFVRERLGLRLSTSSCLRALHRLGFVCKRPKRRLLKADATKRAAFVTYYRTVVSEANARGARILFADEAHFRADGDLRRLWTLRGRPALVDSTSPRRGEKASFYSAVCPETGEVVAMPIDGNSCAATSAGFLGGVRQHFAGPLVVIWDNGAAHHGQALREFLRTPKLDLRLIALPAYSPDFNPDEAIWKWVRDEVTANTCFGTAARVGEAVTAFFAGIDERAEEVKRRCRTALQELAFADGSNRSAHQLLAAREM
jgi:transposase